MNGANQYIGSVLTLYMTIVEPTDALPYGVSVTAYVAGSSGSVTLSNSGAPNGVTLYITDSIRTWTVTSSSGSIVLDNADLLTNAPASWQVSDYSQLASTTFRVYAGTLLTGATTPTSVSVNIGGFDTAVLNDSGTNGDAVGDDGIWSANFTVPDMSNTPYQTVMSANFYGVCTSQSVAAGNGSSQDPFPSSQTINFDMLRPQISTYSFTTTNPNYNGDLYLSSVCEGQPAATTVQPTNAQATWNFTVNKPDTTVNIWVDVTTTGGVAVSKHLVPFTFPTTPSSYSGWTVWQGDDGAGNFAYDGIYPVHLYIHDLHGVSGTPIVTQVKVISLKMGISNITMSPPSIPNQPVITDGVISVVNYTVSLTNDSANAAMMNRSLAVLGWTEAGKSTAPYTPDGVYSNGTTININGINSTSDLFSTIWSYQKKGLLSATGTLTPFAPGVDASDDDTVLAGDLFPYLQIFSQQYYNIASPDPETTDGMNCSAQPPASTFMVTGDGNATNDWRPMGLVALGTVNGVNPGLALFTSSTAPVTISTQTGFTWDGSTPPEGTYRLDLQSILTGVAFTPTATGLETSPSVVNPCVPSEGAYYTGIPFHFWPQDQIDTLNDNLQWNGIQQGDGISATDTSFIFTVANNALPTGDNTPPQFLASNPQNSSIIAPGAYSSNTPLTAQFSDPTSNIISSSITLAGPGGTIILGTSATNGGGPNGTTVEFYPNNPIIIGGDYTMTATACNANGLCSQESIPFIVLDETAPSIAQVQLIGGNGEPLSPNLSLLQTGPQGPYTDVAGVVVTLSLVNTANTYDWPDSNVSLYQVSGTTLVSVPITRVTVGTPTNNALTYTINTPLNANGTYQVDTLTESVDGSGDHYIGPASLGSNGTNTPQFTVAANPLDVSINWDSTGPTAISGLQPLTVTVQGQATGLNLLNLGVVAPTVTLPADSGYGHLSTDLYGVMAFSASGVPLTSTPLVWNTGTPVDFSLYYAASDLTAAAVTTQNLLVRGWNGTDWQNVSFTLNSGVNEITISPPYNGSTAADIFYAIAYQSQSVGGNPTATPTGTIIATTVSSPTPISLPSTRAFDPWNSNPLYQKARFYYSTVAPASMEARVYDTSGGLIRDLTLGNGITASQSAPTDATGDVEYYFTWDGTNSAGTVVHNGIYLVRWTETGIDGSHNTQTRPVALIK